MSGKLALSPLLFALLLPSAISVRADSALDFDDVVRDAASLQRVEQRVLRSTVHLVRDVDPAARDQRVRAVIEIPTGTTQKWEVDKASGNLVWELRKGKPRRVKYLGYPGNYGMIPRTELSTEFGGDGDPLDILVLGPAVPRGAVLDVRVIGLLRMLDKGEQDDKLVAVPASGALRKIDSIAELDRKFPGVSDIVSTWFANYKGADKIEVQGYAGPDAAWNVLSRALEHYVLARESTPVEHD